LSEFHASFSRDDQYSTPTGLVDPALPSIILSAPTNFELGNAGFAGGRTNEAQWELAERIDYIRGKHSFKFGVEGNRTHITDLSFGGFDPDAQKQNGSLGGAYAFSTLQNFALGIYDTYAQSSGNPKFSFAVPYLGFYAQDSYQIRPRLTLDLGLRQDFQIYPQPKENPAFPLTGQFPNQYQRWAPKLGFAWQPAKQDGNRRRLWSFL
jgi:outer membrane receptor protein involved in Fe transport